MNIRDWPSVLKSQPLPVRFVWQRAIHGKPLGFGRDFGFVASSKGFQGNRREIENRFRVADQKKGEFALWWPSGNRFYATWCYPSRFPDESGRRGLETQILEWERIPDVSPALAAVVTLARVAKLTTDDWIDNARDKRFAGIGFELSLDHLTENVPEAQFESLITSGLEELNRVFSPADLKSLYEALLWQKSEATLQPIVLASAAPLTPVAMGSLLLPLGSTHGESCSLAGKQVEHSIWNVIVAPAAPARAPIQLPAREADLPSLIAEAIRTATPRLARGPHSEVRKILEFARDPVCRTPPAELLPGTAQNVSEAEESLIRDAANQILQNADAVPEYLAGAHPKVQDGYRSHMRAKADYVIAWAFRLNPPLDLTPWQDYLTRPGNAIRDILAYWLRQKNLPVIATALDRLDQPTPSIRSSKA
jgi:hypothetical protein